jgi:dTDP-glucose 4,6-dehydratase
MKAPTYDNRVVVTGSAGTIGSQLVPELEDRGHNVFGIDLQHQAEGQRADVGNYRQLRFALQKAEEELGRIDYLYHLAAEFGRHNGEQYYEAVWQTNAIGTRNVLALQEEFGFKLIFASSSEVYGDSYADTAVLSEDITKAIPPTQWNDYAISKWVNELQIRHVTEVTKSDAMILRFFNAYGPGERYHPYRSVVCLFGHAALNSLPVTVYRGYERAFMYIDDFIPTLANACSYFRTGQVINIGGSEVRSVEELWDIVVAECPWYAGEVTYLDKEALNVRDKRPDLTLARSVLGHNPLVTLEEGVPETVAWLSREQEGDLARQT